MIDENETIKLGREEFSVPPLVIGICRHVYPRCARLTKGTLEQRWYASDGDMEFADDEFADLCDIAFWLTVAAGANPDRAAFDRLAPFYPMQLMMAFYVARWQTGVWEKPVPAPAETDANTDDDPGEAPGETPAPTPPKKKTRRK